MFTYVNIAVCITLIEYSTGYLPVVLRLQEVELLLDAFQCIGDGELDWTLRWWSLFRCE